MKLICLFETQLETQFKIDLCETLRSQQNGATLQFARMKLICLFETQLETQFKIDLCETLRSQQNGAAKE